MSDDQDFALTVIGFVGHVFSPSYYRARQPDLLKDHIDRVAIPEQFCAFNFALHALTPRGEQRLGAKELWSLSEYSDKRSQSWRDRVHREEDCLTLGGSNFKYTQEGLSIKISERSKPFFQHMPSHIEGEIKVTFGDQFKRTLSLDQSGHHHWMGVSPTSRITVELDHPALSFTGHAYHDSNWGDDSLESAFQSWTWSRAEVEGGTLVMYDAVEKNSPPCHRALLYHRGGEITELSDFDSFDLPHGFWGVQRPTRVDRGSSGAKVIKNLVDSPFYTRDVIQTRVCQQETYAIHESLDLTRFESPWVRFLIPFRIRRL